MRFGFVASVLFHLCIAGSIIVWGRDWGAVRDYVSEPSIPIELITEAKLAEITNVPATVEEAPSEDLAEPEIPDDPVPIEPDPIVIAAVEPEIVAPPPPPEQDIEPEVAKEEQAAKPEPPKEEPKPDPPAPKPVVKKEKPKAQGLDLDALDKLAKQAKDNDTRAPRETPGAALSDQTRSGSAGGELTASEKALVRAKMLSCWRPLDGAPNPETLRVEVQFKLNRDGSLAGNPKVLNSAQIALSGNRFWQVAQQNAVRAILECQPYDFLPQDRYENWKEFIFNFAPDY